MQNSQQPPFAVQNQSTLSDENDEVALLRNSCGPRPVIGRSNSAPQAQNRFGSNRQGMKSKLGTGSKASATASKIKHLPIEEHNIPTLSDGVICVNHEQAIHAAACVLTSHEQMKGHPLGSNGSDSTSPLSSTPLCDTNHSPSSTKRYYEKTSPVFDRANSEDVWQLRENFEASDHLDGVNADKHLSRPKDLHPEHRDIPAPRASKTSQQINGIKNTSGHTMTNGPQTMQNGIESKSGVLKDNQSLSGEGGVEWHTVEIRSNPQRCPFRQAQSEMILSSDMQRKMSLANVKEKGYARLEEELMKAHKALEMKDEEVDELRGIRERLMKEVSDFTAALFEEVNSQLNEAAISEQQARKQLKEANAKIEVLSAEVAALKDLVLTSTPSSPNKHLHPQIDNTVKKDKGGKPFWKTHRRSTSHHQFTTESREKAEANEHHSLLKELDTVAFDEFKRWRLQPTMEFSGQYFARVQQEDIQPCLNFRNTKLADKLLESVKLNTLSIEPIPGDQSYPRKCCLSDCHKLCNYKIKFEGADEWYSISQMSRNRIAAVCDFYAYLRYIVQGFVKCSEKDMFAELVRLRNQMAQSRLGLL